MTREEIEQLNEVEQYCFETNREEQYYRVELQERLSIADANPKSPWISVEDDLPCNNPNNIHFGFTNNVLVIDDNKNTGIAFIKKYKNNEWI